jgi:hypothetical protein
MRSNGWGASKLSISTQSRWHHASAKSSLAYKYDPIFPNLAAWKGDFRTTFALSSPFGATFLTIRIGRPLRPPPYPSIPRR